MLVELIAEALMSSEMTTRTAALDVEDRVGLIFRALASRPRREILELLATGGGKSDTRCCSDDEVCACVFSDRLGIGAPTVSHHMRALLDAGLVTADKRGQWVYYRLVPDAFSPVLEELRAFMSGCGAGAQREPSEQ